MWYYGIQLWGSAKPSNTSTIQAFQSICLRLISGAPRRDMGDAGECCNKVWIDKTVTSHRDAFVKRLSTGPKNSTGK
ncbi:putative RNA-directed DNA polymerase, partial [Aphis craccivora]